MSETLMKLILKSAELEDNDIDDDPSELQFIETCNTVRKNLCDLPKSETERLGVQETKLGVQETKLGKRHALQKPSADMSLGLC